MADRQAIARARYRLILEDFQQQAGGARGGWQDAAAEALGVSQALVSKIARGEREAGARAIALAMQRLRIHPDFFYDASLTAPEWRLFVGRSAGSDLGPEPPFWGEFLANYDRVDELDPEDLEKMRGLGFSARRGVRLRSWTDWAVLADWVLNRRPSDRFERGSKKTSVDP